MLNPASLFTGAKLRLAAPMPEDGPIIARWSQDSHYLRLLDDDPARLLTQDEAGRGSEFRLRTLAENRLIGFVAIFGQNRHQSAMIAIGIGDPEYRGQGYGSDALRLILAYGFRELNLHRIGLNVFAYNTTAIRAYERVGFVLEGRRRQSILRDGQRFDELQYGILYPEWAARYAPQG
ncbi:MAG: GNAT family N-acetyltransferase [Anaerolineae bacterium]|jgi:RimJ/RimL family protein N-acetyltransferase|nr:GNAT family N-acetyltransferase [Anaerolineae bacterium]